MSRPFALLPAGRRLAAGLLAALLLGLSGCEGPAGPGPQGESAPTQSPEAVTTQAAEASALPTESLPPALPEPEDAEAAAALYEAVPMDYEPLEREAAGPNAPIPAPRYRRDDAGVWRRETEPEGPAVLMLTGDLMCQTRQQEAAATESGYDFRDSFTYVAPVLAEADLVIGNLEATLSEGAPYMAEAPSVEGKPHLNAPAVFLEALRGAGFDLLVMSNNHNCDAGVRGVYDTLDRVEEYGFIHTGTFRGSREPRFALAELKGIRFGVFSYSCFFNGKQKHFTEDGQRLLLNPYDPDVAAADAAAARAAGAEYLLVYIHWGSEYTNSPKDSQRRIVRELADAGFDCIVGSHPHALQPFEFLQAADGRRVPVFYSLGNFVSHQRKLVTKDTLILRLAFVRDPAGAVTLSELGYIPCRVFQSFLDHSYAVLPLTEPYAGGRRSRLFAPAYERITEILGPGIPALGEPPD